MERISSSSARTAGFTLCSAMVAALLAGCAGQTSVASATGAQVADASIGGQGDIADKALAKAEARVAKSPANASARSDLAQVYLAAGRFDSAATTFEDAIALGDKSPRNGLSLALAYIGSGRNAQALGVLSQWRDQIPAGDFGLAIALAGQPAQGVAVLTDTLRGGENNAKVRQNLAYAYALDGRWAESRVIAGQDVPPDQLEQRMTEWASRARPEQSQVRVAGLLGTPMRADPGQPVALALNGVEHAARMAVAEVPGAPAPEFAGSEFAGSELAASELPAAELPAIEPAEDYQVAQAPAPAVTPVAHAAPIRRASTIERAFERPAIAEHARPRVASHIVQLGSFSTREGAQRAWGIFQKRDARLRDHTLRITEAEVNGRRYFRVAAVGFDRNAAQTMCSTVKQRGGGCLAYAEGQRMPGVLPLGSGPLKARR
ncbi:tetratricopeptide repeat protein [Novosphingobium sp. BL-52-GroH]|uniref:SPOR domain-containing protein n=1 Tax=Novosphingobium sp. BL-52-GroH TaxID=3349877 RepID=UPI00384D53D9